MEGAWGLVCIEAAGLAMGVCVVLRVPLNPGRDEKFIAAVFLDREDKTST